MYRYRVEMFDALALRIGTQCFDKLPPHALVPEIRVDRDRHDTHAGRQAVPGALSLGKQKADDAVLDFCHL